MPKLNYVCPKCASTEYETSEMRATGGFWSKVFDVQNQKFSVVTCNRCRYSEFYKASSSALGNIFDFLSN